MTAKELKSLRRADLLEMLIESEKLRANAASQYQETVDDLRTQITELTNKLHSKELDIEDSGNLAEACLKINGVLDSAQLAAAQFLENITLRHRNVDDECEERLAACEQTAMRILEETQEKCSMLEQKAYDASFQILQEAQKKLDEAEEQCADMRQKTIEECEKMRVQARQYAENYFKEKNGKLQKVLAAYQEVESIING